MISCITVALCIRLVALAILIPPLIALILAAPLYVRPILPHAIWYGFWSWLGRAGADRSGGRRLAAGHMD